MKNLIVKCAMLSAFLMASYYGNCQTISNLKGTWHNDLRSILKITAINSTTGQLSGTYTLKSGQTFQINGWVNDLPPSAGKDHVIGVAFSVRFGSFGSITSWTGYLTTIPGSTKLKIQTIWNLVRPNSDLSFDHILTNCDVFTL